MSRAEKLLLVVLLVAAIGLCTPMVSWLGAGQATWFGLPAAMVWVICWLGLVFFALVAAHWTAQRVEAASAGAEPGADA